jgi:hypothetical protein
VATPRSIGREIMRFGDTGSTLHCSALPLGIAIELYP